MKKIIPIILCLAFLAATNCKKEKQSTPPHQLGIRDIVDSLVGSYMGVDYQFSFGGGMTHLDTVYNQPLSISKFNDSVIVTNESDTLRFIGNLINKDYRFEWNYSSVYSDKFISLDSILHTIYFDRTTDNGGYGGTNYSLQVTR